MTPRKRRLRKRAHIARIRNFAIRTAVISFVAIFVVAALGGTLAYAFVHTALEDLPDIDSPDAFKVAQTTKIYSADDKLLASFFLENREVVPMSAIATDLAHAMISVEDERFYHHKGVDYQGIVRAALKNLRAGNTQEGASTITQQYIRNTILLSEARSITYTRKLREMVLARELEKRHSKAEILEMYLNTVYFGDGAYGAEAAARQYFGKHASQLNLGEAALLAGLPQSPNGLNPYRNWSGAKARQRWVLNRMVATKAITAEQANAADAIPIRLINTTDPDQGIYREPYFVSYVRKQLLRDYPDALVFKGGLRVYTTIDTRLNKYAVDAVRSVLPNKKDPEAALVAIDPRNGFIKAMYGGRDYRRNRYNYATQGQRQPGSSFKMFVLVAALEAGIPPRRPVNASSPMVVPQWHWKVMNSEGSGSGAMSITAATAHSVNVVFARLCLELGASKVAKTAKRMGITSYIPPYPSIALGSAPVSPLDMASAYGVLAAEGIRHRPTGIVRILDSDGNVIYQHTPKGLRVLSKSIAWAATQQLLGVVRGGTGRRASLPGREVAGKTGTAQNYQDAWFCGYTPQMSTAVWMGYAKGSIPMRNVHGQRAFGGTFCAPIWHNFMVRALANQPKLRFAHASPPPYTWKSSWSVEASKANEAAKKKKAGKRRPAGPSQPTSDGPPPDVPGTPETTTPPPGP